MASTIIGCPIRLGLRGASVAIDGTMAVAGHALGLAQRLVEVLTKDGMPDLDIDGSERESPAQRGRPATKTPQPSPQRETEPAPAPIDPVAAHVSEEAVLVDEVADPGAEDGAGAEVHVDEPWDHYNELGADDVIERITGAPTAELAAVQLYEQTHRRRKTVLEAVERELRRTGTQ